MGIASIFSITAMLLILGLFFVLLTNITLAMNAVKEDFETLQVYLLDETTKEQADTMMETIKNLQIRVFCFVIEFTVYLLE